MIVAELLQLEMLPESRGVVQNVAELHGQFIAHGEKLLVKNFLCGKFFAFR